VQWVSQWVPFLAPLIAWVVDRSPAFIDGFIGGVVGALAVRGWDRRAHPKKKGED
jgi:hypothetical protein